MVASSPHWVSPRRGKKKENKRSNYHKKDPSDFLAVTSQSSSSSLSGHEGAVRIGLLLLFASLLIEELTEYQNIDFKQKIMLDLHLWQRLCILYLYLYLYLFGKSSPCWVRLCSLIKDSAWLVNACYGHLTQSPWPSHHLLAQSPNYHQQGTFSVQASEQKTFHFVSLHQIYSRGKYV